MRHVFVDQFQILNLELQQVQLSHGITLQCFTAQVAWVWWSNIQPGRHYSFEQLEAAYPQIKDFFAKKEVYDPPWPLRQLVVQALRREIHFGAIQTSNWDRGLHLFLFPMFSILISHDDKAQGIPH